ncbi:hypothetical protein [Mycobacterium sp.]|uniref:hypothetical protein n=1 Tax=Mycobacterium sp. TaxID=1785 RepID=UPI003BAD42B5
MTTDLPLVEDVGTAEALLDGVSRAILGVRTRASTATVRPASFPKTVQARPSLRWRIFSTAEESVGRWSAERQSGTSHTCSQAASPTGARCNEFDNAISQDRASPTSQLKQGA